MTDVQVYEATTRAKGLERLTNEQIRYIANTDIIPKGLRGNPEKIMATILKGRSLGLDDISSLSAIHVIEGRAGLSAETMVHLVRKRGHSIVWEAKPGESCTVVGTRRDNGDTGSVTWTIGMAKDAGLASKQVWKQYPDSMLWVRAVSQLCRMLFADVLMGTSYSPDELEEVAERGRVTEAVSDLPVLEEVKVRTEPESAPSEAILNRIARLEERAGGGAQITLRGVFGVEMASELSADAAARYEAMLELGLPPEVSAEGPEDATASREDSGGGSLSDGEEKSHESPSADDLFDGGEGGGKVEDDGLERRAEIASETVIPTGNYRGTKLGEIHDGWLEYALKPENTARLPEPFVEALELYARERRPEVWTAVRG